MAGPKVTALSQDGHRGLLYGCAAYVLWGLLPLYFAALHPAGAWEIVSLRVVFALVLCLGLVTIWGQLAQCLAAIIHPKTLGLFALSGMLIGCNWLLYTIASTTGHILEASLGYFINPIVAIALGVLVLREKLRRLQWTAVALGALAVLVMSVFYGRIPWIALGLAFSFGFYGLIKSVLGAQCSPLVGLTIETLTIAPAACGILLWQHHHNHLSLGVHGWTHTVLLVSSGAVTVVPLLLFGMAAARLPLSTVGMLQYLAPIMQFILAVTVLHESMPATRWAGFVIVWGAVLVLIADAVHRQRSNRTP